MKKIICFLRGLTDETLEDLNGMTPLEKAVTPALDDCYSRGHCFLGDSSCRSQEEVLVSLLNIEGDRSVLKQGPLCAYYLGHRLQPHQSASCVRFVACGGDVITHVDNELLSFGELNALCLALNEQTSPLGWSFFPLDNSQALLISDFDLIEKKDVYECEVENPLEWVGKNWRSLLSRSSSCTSRLFSNLVEVVASVLTNHEINSLREDLEEPFINGLVFYGVGRGVNLSSFYLPFNFPRVQVWSHSLSFLGVGRLFGFKPVCLEGSFDHRYFLERLIEKILFFEDDILVLDFSYLWEKTLKGDLVGKIKGIEFVDRLLVKPLNEIVVDRGWELQIVSEFLSTIKYGKVLDYRPFVLELKNGCHSSGKFCEKILQASLV